MKALCNSASTIKKHAEQGDTRKNRDEEDVVKIMDFVNQAHNPFDLDTVPKDLINISTGQVASQEVTKSLEQFMDVAKHKNAEFVERRLLEDKKTQSL